jgi:hypothetical protein
MIEQTHNPVVPPIAVLGRTRDGRIAIEHLGQKLAATEEQFLALLREREEQIARMVEDPWRFGWLNPAWERADAAYAELREKFRKGVTELLILGGNRSGKSRYFARKAMQHLVNTPGAKVWCLQSTEAASIQNQQPYLWEYLPKEWKPSASGKLKKGAVANITYSQKGGFTENSFVLPNGSQCWFKFYSMDVSSIEGAELNFCWADELVTPDWLEALRFRLLTRDGELGIGFTPVEGYTTTVKEYLDGAKTLEECDAPLLPRYRDGNLIGLEQVPRIQQCTREKARVVYFHTADNPYGNPEAMETELRGSNRERILMRAYGVPTKARMSMFPAFRENVHVVPPDKIPRVGTVYHFVDPGEGKSWAMLWLIFTPDKRCWIYREFPNDDDYIEGVGYPGPWAEADGKLQDGRPGPAQKACAAFGFEDYKRVIDAAEKKDGEQIDRPEPMERWMDSRYGNTPTMTHEGVSTLIEQCYDRVGLVFKATSGQSISEGVAIINDMLAYDSERPLGADNNPRLFISERCKNLIYALKTWTGADGKKGATKDWIDLLRYIALSDVGYEDPETRRARPGGSY